MKERFNLSQSAKGITKIFILSIPPVVCLVLFSVMDIICICMSINRPFGVNFAPRFLLRFWCLTNVMNYWFFLPKEEIEGEDMIVNKGSSG